ncbi:hypothetical protein KSP39_PZI001985 [Platanthera zijinensis]|uniref:Uncharacterized protein n=1 Tax=Platanthera zijinensis TaxID=2320716 RepID=A0AAP0BYX3_9ASPA
MAPSRLHLLSRFRKAVAKVRFVLSFNLRRWILSSTAAATSHRGLSFDSQLSLPPGLLDATDEFSNLFDSDLSQPPRPRRSVSKGGIDSGSPVLLRTISRAVSGLPATSSDDINQRADDFIHNFYRQLRMERQISLELRYCNGEE